MKKSILVLIAVVFTIGYAQAQFKAGIRVGLNGTSVYGDAIPIPSSDATVESIVGFQAGVVAEYSIGKSFAIQPAVIYANQGYAARTDSGNSESLVTLNLNYVQVPVNLLFKAGSPKIAFFMELGPYVGYALNGKAKKELLENGKVTDSKKESINFDEDQLNRLDAGAGLGLGVQLFGTQIAINYSLGFMNLSKEPDYNFKNNCLALTLSFLF
ncbi:MAG: PorT family protein [Prevotellaceae bacterium]|jgi:hypothetical protein|nr:PorT family protein [Prevotellaceae bacterium]